jgi:plastocyanin
MIHMKISYRYIICTLVLPLAALACGSGSEAPTQAPPVTTGGSPTALSVDVNMPALLFVPSQIDIAQGGTLQFVFTAVQHNVIFAVTPGAPANIDVTNNATVVRQFNTKGTFSFTCTLHFNMNGTVVVH